MPRQTDRACSASDISPSHCSIERRRRREKLICPSLGRKEEEGQTPGQLHSDCGLPGIVTACLSPKGSVVGGGKGEEEGAEFY